jgi:hypothetical protein
VYGLVDGGADDSLFPAQKRKTVFLVDSHGTAEDDQSPDMFPLLSRHFAVEQTHDAIFGSLLLQYFAKETQVFEWIMLKNQDLFHTVPHG